MEYDKQEAIQYIEKGLKQRYSKLSEAEAQGVVQKAFIFDESYMKEIGLFSEEESEQDLIYDEEDAFHYILGEFYKSNEYRKWKETLLEDIIDDFLELKYDYLVSKDLVED